MVEVYFKLKNDFDFVEEISFSGHANYDKIGKDIICASISSIIFGILNAIENMEKENINIDKTKKRIKIKVLKNNQNLKVIFLTLYYQLKTIEDKYKNNLKINLLFI
jgi:uncharacterized protein